MLDESLLSAECVWIVEAPFTAPEGGGGGGATFLGSFESVM